MKILAAGGAGYIGSVLVPKLLDRGYEVDVLDLLWFGNNLPASVRVTRKDIMAVTTEDLAGYDVVIFLGGLSNDPMAEYSPAQNFIHNASAPAYLAYMAKKSGVKRFIYASSCSVYGYTVNELYDEESPAISNYPYGISKLQGEFACLRLRDEKFSVISLRQGTVCGYSPRMRLDLLINTMFKTALADKRITVSNPAIWRPVLSIQDAASAYIRAIEATPNIGGVFNVASANYTLGEVADLVRDGVREHLGLEAELKMNNVQDFRNYKVSIEKARNILSFKPRHEAADIVKDLAQNLDKFNDFSIQRYYNIQTFKALSESRQVGDVGDPDGSGGR